MIYGSVCSGIEAATVAWHELGWQPAWFSEIDKFPSAVLAHHYPSIPNLGDMTKIHERPEFTARAIDLLVGGTPCQSFSVAGLRAGMDDPRGNLALVFLRIASIARPRWIVWENVPGVLSSNGGRDFGSFLSALGQLWYGWAYRVLDAQHFGVPQRRRRVFVVGYLGDWRRSAAVLFESSCLRGDIAPGRKAWEGSAADLGLSFTPREHGTYSEGVGTIRASGGDAGGGPDNLIVGGDAARAFEVGPSGGNFTDLAPTLDARCKDGPIRNQLGLGVAHSLTKRWDSSEDGTGRGIPLVPAPQAFYAEESRADHFSKPGQSPPLKVKQSVAIVFDTTQITSKTNRSSPQAGDPCHPLAAGAHPPSVIYENHAQDSRVTECAVSPQINAKAGTGGGDLPLTIHRATVRRLTPRECERLMGFPDDYTLIPYRGKPAADGPRYKALGNSMAVPCMAWIGERIRLVEDLSKTSNHRGGGE